MVSFWIAKQFSDQNLKETYAHSCPNILSLKQKLSSLRFFYGLTMKYSEQVCMHISDKFKILSSSKEENFDSNV